MLLALPLLFYVLLQIGFFQYYLTSQRAARHFVLPDGYQGFVVMAFDHPSCPSIKSENGVWTFRVSAQGDFCTATALESGFGDDTYSYASDANRNLLSDPLSGVNYIWYEQAGSKLYTFYVGFKVPLTQLQDAIQKRDEKIRWYKEH